MFVRSVMTAAIVAAGMFIGEVQAQTLRFGHANTTAEIAGELFQEFAERVTKATGGAVTIRVFPAEQLGKEVDLVKQVKEGALDMSAPSMAAASALVPALEMASAPFIWRDWNEAEAIIRSAASTRCCREACMSCKPVWMVDRASPVARASNGSSKRDLARGSTSWHDMSAQESLGRM